MKVIITGGGTGGHIFPALSILEELQRRDHQLLVQWVGKKGNLEEKVCQQRGIPFRSVPIRGWPRKISISQGITASLLAISIIRSFQILLRFQPQIVIGVGGYVSFPILWCAQILNIPTVLHEQNSRLGMANRILAKKAKKVFLSFPLVENLPEEIYDPKKFIITGNPVRHAFITPPSREEICTQLGFNPQQKTILVMGGSQGAHTINLAVSDMLNKLEPNEFQIIWITGHNDYDKYKNHASQSKVPLKMYPFYEDMADLMSASDLLVARSGASTLAEITVLAKPSILIPFPYATDNHQEHNARSIENAGAGEVILDKDCSADSLLPRIRKILNDPTLLENMSNSAKKLARPLASETIAEEIIKLVFSPSNN
ncbi:MAG TPA: undecaprenyldiphospho-muramoylpentapeptide beta-N-acetylglucosaminyltransferase [Candidatus Hydrogenedens sp.]|nr:undecaprenyldiphospho-muramoylpentapeptide beta-N-acetylglucosaminyltransferase [Candidatus Hydrogenedens sp.]HOL20430.1 undecaprenyldiphospho-muramoylpentapeptide beta-N-acetylglucosaminyltransferase [Candidatus Hydrogenedens sp.]HPP60021.1 undecaprenyldiphospho-muramoylpentapeptide beta-N-acetylglucosaminyltransferase [Candidatus Hydrogenedens sp.]